MVVHKRDGIPKTRRFERLVGLCYGGEWGVHNHNRDNIVRGLRERVFAVERDGRLVSPPKPSPNIFKTLSAFRSRLLRCLGSCHPWTPEQFLGSYSGAKKASYERAMTSLTQRPLQRSDGDLKAFVKAEKFSKNDPAPRVIQPRSPRYNCRVGVYLKPLEHKVYKAIERIFGSPTVMKGYNADQQGSIIAHKWKKFRNPCGLSIDASRFDQHVSADALSWEHSVYNSVYRSPELRRLLSWQIHNSGRAYTPDCLVKYSVEGCRMSGDMNTALGNCLLMCAMVWQYFEEHDIDGELINNGDDCVLFFEADQLGKCQDMRRWFLDYGFTMKIENPVYRIENVEFCQTHPVLVGGSYRMVRNPLVALDKDGIHLRPGNYSFSEWLQGVGECGLALCSGIPVMQEYYKRIAGKSRREDSGMQYLRGTMESVEKPILEETRVSFYYAFGITPHHQRAVEQSISTLVIDPVTVLTSAEVYSSIYLQ